MAGLAIPAGAASPHSGDVVITAPATGAASAPTGELSLTIALKPSDPGALAKLAKENGRRLSRLARSVAIAGTAPKQSVRDAVVASLKTDGLRVGAGDDPWTINAVGTVATVQRVFKVSEEADGTALVPDRSPRLPAGVQAVLGLDTRAKFHALDAPYGLQPRDLRSAYSVVRPQSAGYGTTVATVQFSGWDSASLGHYAGEIGVPLASGQLTQVPIDGASPSTADGDGDVEVALDQETILGQAPLAKQRAYFAPNTEAGELDMYAQIAADTTAGITSVSSSWGECEADSSAQERAAVQTSLQRMLAAGATFFAASGDSGAYDCSSTTTPDDTLAVDFPASAPETVGVGGTALTNASTNPSQKVWSSSSGKAAPAYLGSGGGGGASSDFSRPSYQSSVGIAGSTRLVPDISADAAPSTGVDVYLTRLGDGQYGGTSLSSPMQAAQIADAASSLGCNSGVGFGDIHPLIYSHPADFSDITSGNNLYYSAATGYDEASGLGSPIWSKLALDLQPSAGCSGGDYFPLTPTRILDTRNGTGAPQAQLGAGQSVNLTVLGVGGIPSSGVSAVVLNVTATQPTSNTYVTVYPGGSTLPYVSNLNVGAGQTIPNLVTVGVGAGGTIALYNNAGSVDLLADVQGYYSDGTSATLGDRFVPLSPSRLLDTRNGTGASTARIGPGGSVSFAVAGQGGVGSTGVAAVALNLTATGGSASTYITAYASGSSRPTVSNLNPSAGQTEPNLAIVPVGSDGKVTLYNDSGTIDLIADVTGYYATAAGTTGSRYSPLAPSRILDTRTGTGAPQSPIGPAGVLTLSVAGAGGVPSTTVTAAVINITAAAPTAVSYVTVYPAGVSRPLASNLNTTPGVDVPNLVTVSIGTNGSVQLYNEAGTTDLIGDVAGYFFN